MPSAEPHEHEPASLPDRIRADLTRAMKARDQPTVTVLRTTLAAIGNAEAPPPGDVAPTIGRLVDHPRLGLADADLDRILRDEIADREETIGQFTRGGRLAEAGELGIEISVLRGYLS